MTFVHKQHKIMSKGDRELKEMRSRLGKTFAEMESPWENLLQEAWKKELLYQETDWWSKVNNMSDPSNADVTNESNNSGDGTSRDDTSEDDSFYIRDTNTHRDGTENNGTNSHLKDVHHNPSQSCDKRTNSNEGRELGKLDQGKQKRDTATCRNLREPKEPYVHSVE